MLFASYCRSIVFWSSVYRMSLIFFWRMISSRCLQSSLLLITAPNIKSSHISSSSSLLYFLVICFSISCVGRRILSYITGIKLYIKSGVSDKRLFLWMGKISFQSNPVRLLTQKMVCFCIYYIQQAAAFQPDFSIKLRFFLRLFCWIKKDKCILKYLDF